MLVLVLVLPVVSRLDEIQPSSESVAIDGNSGQGKEALSKIHSRLLNPYSTDHVSELAGHPKSCVPSFFDIACSSEGTVCSC